MNQAKTHGRKRFLRQTRHSAAHRYHRRTTLAHGKRDEQAAAHAPLMAFLRGVPVFADMPASLLALLSTRLTAVTFPAGATVIAKGTPGECMYVIHTGQVQVHDGNLLLCQLGSTAVFGELALVDGEVRSATVTATTDTELYQLDQQTFAELVARQPTIVHGFVQLLARNLRTVMRGLSVTATAAPPPPRRPVQALHIAIDREQQAGDVQRITESETFRMLQQRARQLKQQLKQQHDDLECTD